MARRHDHVIVRSDLRRQGPDLDRLGADGAADAASDPRRHGPRGERREGVRDLGVLRRLHDVERHAVVLEVPLDLVGEQPLVDVGVERHRVAAQGVVVVVVRPDGDGVGLVGVELALGDDLLDLAVAHPEEPSHRVLVVLEVVHLDPVVLARVHVIFGTAVLERRVDIPVIDQQRGHAGLVGDPDLHAVVGVGEERVVLGVLRTDPAAPRRREVIDAQRAARPALE